MRAKSELQGCIVNLTLDGQPAEAGKKRWEGREERVRRKEERKERDFYVLVWVLFFLLLFSIFIALLSNKKQILSTF